MDTEIAAALRTAMKGMNAPEEKMLLRNENDVHWLGRNLGIQNAAHPNIEIARKCLADLGARMVV